MASNKDSKTSKTAHVMNLLSKNRGTAAPAAASEPEAAAPSEPAAAPAPTPQAAPAAQPIAPIITSINADAAVSSQIKDALEASLNQAEPAVQTPPAPAPEPAPVAPPPAPKAAPAPAPSPEPAAPAAKAPRQEAYEPPAYVNVMEVLVREKAEKYMRASHMCCCDHCMVDVMAYTLNHLSPKYVVMTKTEMIPKLTFYEVQNSSDITTQLMRACEIVAKSPHHGRI